jgi:hypothetical protein
MVERTEVATPGVEMPKRNVVQQLDFDFDFERELSTRCML